MSIEKLLKPKSIAVIGASGNISRVGGRLYNNLIQHGFKGDIYLVNPKHQTIGDMKCYSRLSDIPRAVDVMLVAVPADTVFPVLEEAGKLQIKSAIVYSSGFSEIGEEGRLRQERLEKTAQAFDISICGPNCVGIINFQDHIAMSFSQFLNAPGLVPGRIAFISQSGALGGSLLNRAQDKKIGFSFFVSGGNEAVLDSTDFMEYFIDDPNTKVIMALLEGVRKAEKFLKVSEKALKKDKPIIVMKVGKTKAGGKAASSHTASMTGTDEVYDGIFRQQGIIRVDDLDDLYLTASAFEKSRLPRGQRVGILTSTGGGGVILTDRLVESGMSVPEPSSATASKLSRVVPSFTSVNNPFDLTAQLINDPQLFQKALVGFANDENFDAIIVATSMVAGELSEKRAAFIIEGMASIEKPLFSWWAAGSLSAPGMEKLEESRVPYFTSAAQCVNALKALVDYAGFKNKCNSKTAYHLFKPLKVGKKVSALLSSTEESITEDKGKKILAYYRIPVTVERSGRNLTEVREIAKTIGYPVALKVISPQIKHKSDAGGLRLDINDQRELDTAYEEILNHIGSYNDKAEIRGFLIQEMVTPGKEVIIGVKQDPQFGPVIIFGLGGIFVEGLKDFSLRRAPLRETDAWEMIEEIKGYPLLAGVRGEKRCDLQTIVRVLMSVSQMALDLKGVVSEIDINPLVVYPDGMGAKVVDCLFIKK